MAAVKKKKKRLRGTLVPMDRIEFRQLTIAGSLPRKLTVERVFWYFIGVFQPSTMCEQQHGNY